VSRSVKLFAVAVLAILFAASTFGFASAQDPVFPISVRKLTTNGDTTTLFHFTLSSGAGVVGEADLTGGSLHGFDVEAPGTFILRETVPSGWTLENIVCGFISAVVPMGGVFGAGSFGVASYDPQQFSTYTVNLADHSVTIVLAQDIVFCTFTNSPATRGPVGGFMQPVNNFTIAAPYLTLFGIVAAVAVVVWKKREN
jgi:hypothetical protein